MSKQSNIWPKQITVDVRIVKILSEQTYENFPNAIKELITNSYDADATKVEIKINLPSEIISLEDDGWGMSDNEFSEYIRIAGEKKQTKQKTPSGRYVIGQFGVGFLSIFPFFKTFSIETKKKRSSEILYASIPCYKYFTGSRHIDIGDIDVQGGIRIDSNRFNDSYTKITLTGFTEICKGFFFPVADLKKRKNSIFNQESVERLKWQLCEDLPLQYEDKRFNSQTTHYSPNLPFRVYINSGEPLLRKTYGNEILEESQEVQQIGNIKFKYFMLTDRKSITPYEARYIKIRNLNVGVGERTNFGLGTEVGGARSRLHQLTGELHIIEGLNGLITVSREGFNFSPDYEKLKELIIKRLASLSNKLEKEAEYEDFIKQSSEDTRIKNIKLLDPKVATKKMTKIGRIAGKNNQHLTSATPKTSFEKKMRVNGKIYKVKLGNWHLEYIYPAIKIEHDVITINEDYPLFKGVKYTDLFIKFHLLLYNSLKAKKITKEIYSDMVENMLELFDDYKK